MALVEFFNYRLASDDGNGDIIVGYQYEYDNGGNITDIKAEVDGALIPLEHYEYDEKQGQLKEAIRYENGVEADRWTYSYDTAGNILSEDHEGSNSELHEYAYEDGRWGDLLTSVDGIDLEYDGSGNPTLYANGTELLWNMEWQNGRQLSRATTERDSTTEDVLDFAYDANGIRTRKTVTRNTYRPVQTYKVTFVADGKTVKTMNVTEGYTLKDSDYPAVPEKAGYTGAWQRYTSPVKSNVTVSATYTRLTAQYTVTFLADGFTVKTMQVYSGYVLKDSDYPSVPEKVGYTDHWNKITAPITKNTFVYAVYYSTDPTHIVTFYFAGEDYGTLTVDDGYILQDCDYPELPTRDGYTAYWDTYTQPIRKDITVTGNWEENAIIPPQPTDPPEIMSGDASEPVEAGAEAYASGALVSTETVTHEYLTQSGKIVREVITAPTETTTLDFFYDDSGRPFAFNYSVDGSDFETYYYILNLQGDVVQIIDANGVMQAEYIYSPWGEVISAEGDLAEINPLRYRGYYYDSETGFYYLQSRYYDPENHRFINADCIAKTEYLSISTNVFVYCLNSPVYCIDSSGADAIWLQERDSAASMGHSGLMVQDTNEEWFFFYWGPASETFSTGLLTGVSNGCYVVKIATDGHSLSDVEDIQTVLKNAGGDPGNRAEKITDAYYFKGDYTNTYEKVMEMEESGSKYNLITRNCLQQTLEAFIASDQRFKFVSYGLVNGVVPNEAVRRVAMIPSQKEKTPWKLIFVAMFSL